MATPCDVLIVGAGPTGLMMACQLARHGISLRLIDKQASRTHESRAFGVQAKTMEIFQNLGLAEAFLSRMQLTNKGMFFVNGKKRAEIDLTFLQNFHTPFPRFHILPQSETEIILGEDAVKHGVTIERQVELVSFADTGPEVVCEILHLTSGKHETLQCKYIVSCDGAHSFVRETLGIPFEGAPYEQQFVLADAKVEWPYDPANLKFFFSATGLMLQLPLTKTHSRLLGARFKDAVGPNPPPVQEVEALARDVTCQNVKLLDAAWLSRFHLHHRAAKDYRKGRAFLAGDAAHIHTPVGAQGMNTGLQDATNLAWKLAYVVKNLAIEALLDTYQSERRRVGQILLRTTDRMFGLVTARGPLATPLRNFFFPLVIPLIFNLNCLRTQVFRFMSQLAIRYHTSAFVFERTRFADAAFRSGPAAGRRAPDAKLEQGTLFELIKGVEANVLIFCDKLDRVNEIEMLRRLYAGYVRVHVFEKDKEPELFQRYGMRGWGTCFIRPDGYIGFRSYGEDLRWLKDYLEKLLPGC
ncbi:MAG: FAD-dependent monooxygenase [Proteobacteria bacterium]|nr:FAD-dependent monooxygenase [Pseudomonadota bacterium]